MTRVGIIGAGPAGLFLSHLLHRAGIESVVLEARSRADVEATIRAGVLEQGTVDALEAAGVGERMGREGRLDRGLIFHFDRSSHRIDLQALTGRAITLYPQHEVLRDLIAARLADGGQIEFEASAVAIDDLDSPRIRYLDAGGTEHELRCDFIAGCDGYHGISRAAIPARARIEHARDYPFGWFGMLVRAPRSSEELIYAHSTQGFALVSTRTPEIQRIYLQCSPDDTPDAWPDARIWTELHARLQSDDGFHVAHGEIFQKGVIAMRSFVVEPMQYRRLFLCGDAAHIVPPTGAKGMNLAVHDVVLLARALVAHDRGDGTFLERYSADALRRVWQAQRFAWWMTAMLHRFPGDSAFQERIQLAELAHLTSSRAAATAFAESYVG